MHSLETEGGSVEIPKLKPKKKQLLITVMGGAAAAGLLFMFLHLRFVQSLDLFFRLSDNAAFVSPYFIHLNFYILFCRRNVGEKVAQPSKTSSHKNKEKVQKNSTQKSKRINQTKEVYPAENIQLK